MPDGTAAQPKPWYQWLADFLAALRSIFVSVVVIGAFVFIGFLVASEIRNRPVTILSISIPQNVKDIGYTSDVVTSHIVDAIKKIQTKSYKYGIRRRFTVSSDNDVLQVKIPDIEISLGTIVQYIKEKIGISNTQISGELVCSNSPCTSNNAILRVRMGSDKDALDIFLLSATSYEDIYTKAAEGILSLVDVYTLAGYYYNIDNLDSAESLAHELDQVSNQEQKLAVNLLGLVEARRGQYANAIEEFRRALRLDPGFVQAMVNAGNAYSRMGDYQAALKIYRQASALDPTNAMIFYSMGVAARGANDLDAAAEDYGKALSLDPAYDAQLFLVAASAANGGQRDFAQHLCDICIKSQPNGPFADKMRELSEKAAAPAAP